MGDGEMSLLKEKWLKKKKSAGTTRILESSYPGCGPVLSGQWFSAALVKTGFFEAA